MITQLNISEKEFEICRRTPGLSARQACTRPKRVKIHIKGHGVRTRRSRGINLGGGEIRHIFRENEEGASKKLIDSGLQKGT